MGKSGDEGVVVGAVVHAAAILRHLTTQPAPSGVNPIARATGVSPSSCYNILRTLVRERLVAFDPVAKTYRPGPGLAELAATMRPAVDAFAAGAALLQDFSDRYGSTTALWRLAPSERLVLLGSTESGSATRIHMTVGHRLPMLAGAGGRCVAAALSMPPSEVAERYASLRWDGPPGLARFHREVDDVARRGWGLDDGDFLSGVTTIATVLPAAGRPELVLGASWFKGQRSGADLREAGAALLTARDRLGVRLGQGQVAVAR